MSAFEGTPSPIQCGRPKWKPPKALSRNCRNNDDEEQEDGEEHATFAAKRSYE